MWRRFPCERGALSVWWHAVQRGLRCAVETRREGGLQPRALHTSDRSVNFLYDWPEWIFIDGFWHQHIVSIIKGMSSQFPWNSVAPLPYLYWIILSTLVLYPDENCRDKYFNCNVVVQARLCVYDYYKTTCCASCSRVAHKQSTYRRQS